MFFKAAKTKRIDKVQQIADIFRTIKPKVQEKIKNAISGSHHDHLGSSRMYPKHASIEARAYAALERSFTTNIGLTIQDVATLVGDSVVNIDNEGRMRGVDLRTKFGEGQLKSNNNTQSGTHAKDSRTLLKETTSKNKTKPFFAIAFDDKKQEYEKDGILYLHGAAFWEKINVNYEDINAAYGIVLKELDDWLKIITKNN
jgi:hypothetical protein